MGEVLGARNPTTIRELWLRVLDRHTEKFGIPYSANAKPRSLGQCKCGKRWPCPDYVDAVAALDQLNNAEKFDMSWTGHAFPDKSGNLLLIPDPGVGAEHA